jgi:hypothetical protein
MAAAPAQLKAPAPAPAPPPPSLSLASELVEDMLEPGLRPAAFTVVNRVLLALVASLLGMLLLGGFHRNVHVYVLLGLALALWASLSFFRGDLLAQAAASATANEPADKEAKPAEATSAQLVPPPSSPPRKRKARR